MILFSGNSNINLARQVAKNLAINLGNATVNRFSDGEINIKINQNVRGKDVFILQSTSSPTNDNLMELLILADAISRASASRITAVMPYFGYARQDRRVRSDRVPISAKVVANMLTAAKINRLLTIDLHSEQIQGFFDIPVDNIYASNFIIEDIKGYLYDNGNEDLVVVSPDIGGVQRARAFAKLLSAELAIVDKRRPEPNKSEVMNIIGNVKNKTCLLVDDMIDTGGSLDQAAKALISNNANEVFACATHAVCSGEFNKKIKESPLKKILLTDTIHFPQELENNEKIIKTSVAPFLAESIIRVANEESLSAVFGIN